MNRDANTKAKDDANQPIRARPGWRTGEPRGRDVANREKDLTMSKTTNGFAVTFERYFPHDDDEDVCEADERGFVIQDVSLRDAMRLGLEYSRPDWSGACEPNCYPAKGVRWLTFDNWNDCTRERIEHGISESRSLHLPAHLTESSRARICRLFGAYGCK